MLELPAWTDAPSFPDFFHTKYALMQTMQMTVIVNSMLTSIDADKNAQAASSGKGSVWQATREIPCVVSKTLSIG
jgi:hypothetical protein